MTSTAEQIAAIRCTTTSRGSAGVLVPFMVASGVVVADQLSKLAASSQSCGRVICPLRNEALFLGLGAGTNVNAIATGVGGLAVFMAWVRVARRGGTVPTVAVACVVAGIVANTIDRLTLGSVRDFLAIPGGVVVNVADIAEVGGLLACVRSVATSLLRNRPISERG